MKAKHLFHTLLASAMLAAMTMTGCSESDNPVTNSEITDDDYDPLDGQEEDYTYIAPDGLEYFMSHIIGRDSLGNFSGFINGKVLDEADPTVLSIGVGSLDEAESIFRSFIAAKPGDILSITPGNVTYTPKDSLGNKQGEIYLNTSDDCIAKITFSDNIEDDHVSEIRFINSALWPDNDISQFEFGKLYGYKKDNGNIVFYETEKSNGDAYLCIKSGGKGQDAWLIWIAARKYSFQYDYKWTEEVHAMGRTYYNDCVGAWWTEARAGGYIVWKTHIRKENKGQPDTNHDRVSTVNALKNFMKIIYKNWDVLANSYGTNRLDKNDIYWSDERSGDIVTFRLLAAIFSKNKIAVYRAYTSTGHWNRCKTVSYDDKNGYQIHTYK